MYWLGVYGLVVLFVLLAFIVLSAVVAMVWFAGRLARLVIHGLTGLAIWRTVSIRNWSLTHR